MRVAWQVRRCRRFVWELAHQLKAYSRQAARFRASIASTLNQGQAKQVTIALDQRSYQYWSEPRQQWVTDYGNRKIFVGDADVPASLPLSDTVSLVERNP
jgi:beta-glucosidase